MVYRPTARVLAVLELLQSSGQMTGQQLAAKLEVDVRTVRRYITTLQDIGIPIEAEIGRYGGYTIRPGFKLPPLMLTEDEVLTLSLGLLLARRSGLAGAAVAAETTLAKIERVLPLALRERLRALVEATQMEEMSNDASVDGAILAVVSLAQRQHRCLRFTYRSGTAAIERTIDPHAVIYHHGRWYTVGYCHLRQAQRIFRLDRVHRAELLESTFTPPADFEALDYLLSSFEAIPDTWNVDVLLEMPLAAARSSIPRELATLVETDQGTRLHASIHDLNFMARTLIGLGCGMKAIHPPELRAELLAIATQIRQYAEPDGKEK